MGMREEFWKRRGTKTKPSRPVNAGKIPVVSAVPNRSPSRGSRRRPLRQRQEETRVVEEADANGRSYTPQCSNSRPTRKPSKMINATMNIVFANESHGVPGD